jgi:hypothetical protein
VFGAVPTASIKGRATTIWYSKGAHGIELGRLGAVE